MIVETSEVLKKYSDIIPHLEMCGCENGWAKILDEHLAALSYLNKKSSAEIRVLQIKEKFGGLRCYISWKSEDPALADILDTLESSLLTKSLRICEFCGAENAKQTDYRWIKTLCPICTEKYLAGKRPWSTDWNS